MRFSELPAFIITMYKEQSEDDLKANWLSNPFKDGSFNDYKEKVTKEYMDSLKSKVEVEVEAVSGMDQALGLLDSLGGGDDGG